jgi:hypothetical protein
MKQWLLIFAVALLVLPCACQTTGGGGDLPPETSDLSPLDDPNALPAPQPMAEPAPIPASDAAPVAPIEPEGLAVATTQRFSDVPIPADVNEVPERSYVFQSANLRIGRMVYSSRKDVASLANFYITECPAGGWKRNSQKEVEGMVEVDYTKDGMRLTIIVRDRGFFHGREVVVHLTPDGGSSSTQ